MTVENESKGENWGTFSRFGRFEPEEIRRKYLATPGAGDLRFGGSFTPALVPIWNQTSSGVWVPRGADRHSPLDGMLTYITADEVFGFSVRAERVLEELQGLTVETVLAFVAGLLNELQVLSRDEVDRKYAALWFKGEALVRVNNLLDDREQRRGLVAPQVLLVLLKLALQHCGDSLLPHVEPGNVVVAMLVVAEHLTGHLGEGISTVIDDTPGPIGSDLIANQLFHGVYSAAHMMGRFVRRWHQLPVEMAGQRDVCDLPKAYEDATGVPLADLTLVGAGLWASAYQGRWVVPPDYFTTTDLTPEALERVLALIATDIPRLRADVRAEKNATAWSFEMFRRSPVVRLADGRLLVLDQELLLDRVFGWWPMLDIKQPPNGRPADKARSDAAEGCLRHLTEVAVIEVLRAIAGTGTARRMYDDDDLRAAFPGQGQKIADAAIDYGDAWVVVEVTATRLRQSSKNAASEKAQIDDMDKLVKKAGQIDATIRALKSREYRLTGVNPTHPKTFYPVLVMAEGFPANPVTLTVLRERVRKAGLLTGAGIAPLEILDAEEAEMIESLQETGGPGLRDILEGKRSADLYRASVRDYIIRERGLNPRRARRLEPMWESVLDGAARRQRAMEQQSDSDT